jgi:DNA replication protein DnaC
VVALIATMFHVRVGITTAWQAMRRQLRRAHFDEQTTLEGFDFAGSPKLPAAQIRDLAALRWRHNLVLAQHLPEVEVPEFAGLGRDQAGVEGLQHGESIPAARPGRCRETHVAQALGHLAIRHGAEVRFDKTSRVLAHLAGGHADRTWPKRLAELTRPHVLILDDFAIREYTVQQADDLYELISERAQAGRSLITTSNRNPPDWYTLFPNPVVAKSLLDRLVNTSHQVLGIS